jgi:hypothetical protein
LDIRRLNSFGGTVGRFEHSVNSSHHLPFVVHLTRVVRCELGFQAVGNRVGFL